ncbi:MAG TPA: GNAT family N-acetyltransferase [Caldimonas sp.]|nr:GNAT family N-acetyltransferase [Caldimonas sp.]
MLLDLVSTAASASPAPVVRELDPGVRIRRIRPSDLELERRFVYGLSARSRYLRLLSARPLQPGELERWTNIDPQREIALVALVNEGGDDEEIGVARCVVEDAGDARWDFAIVIADAWQRRGLGVALLGKLVEAAREHGVRTLSGITLFENRGMVKLARKVGFSVRFEEGDATLLRLELRLDR